MEDGGTSDDLFSVKVKAITRGSSVTRLVGSSDGTPSHATKRTSAVLLALAGGVQ